MSDKNWSPICLSDPFNARNLAYLLGFVVVYAFLFSFSIPSFIDEAYSFNLATDRSLSHMLSALRDGADGALPLYAISIFFWEKLFGHSELSLRLSSGLLVVCFVWQTARRLGREFGSTISALAILFVLADWAFTFYCLQTRFYALLIFVFSLCFWSTWDLLQDGHLSVRHRVSHALICGLVCLSHPLGMVYTAVLALIYLIFSVTLGRFSVWNATAFLGGPAFFFLWLPSFLRQRLVNPVYAPGRPGWEKYWEFVFIGSTVLFVTLLVGALALIAARWVSKSEPGDASRGSSSRTSAHSAGGSSRRLLVWYSLVFIVCLNGTIALLDGLHITSIYWTGEGGIRYGLVCWVGYVVVIAAMLHSAELLIRFASARIGVGVHRRVQFILVVIALLTLMESHWWVWFRIRSSDQSYLSRISEIAKEKHLGIVCQARWDAFYLATRMGTSEVKYLLADDFPYKHLMLRIAKHYPNPAPVEPQNQAQLTNEYLFVSYSPRDAWIVGKR